jgi:TDG/mug DNA glycosylase family protein
MIKYKISKNAAILFVGINPHFGSYKRGVPFSNNKMFWYLLSEAGIIKETREFLRDDASLKKLYTVISKKYKINFINIIDKPTKNVSQLKKGEETKGVKRLYRIIRQKKPKLVCFIGKVTFNKFKGDNKFRFGVQGKISNSIIYVMHFPIRGYASIRIKELKNVKKLARL